MKWLEQLFSRRRCYDELSASIQEHLDEKVFDLMEDGMPKDEAERAARREFGNVSLIEQHSREAWQWSRLESLWADMRYALRQIRKSPAFVITACLTLALGIGANLTVFLIFYGVLLRPLPFPQADRLVRISRFYPVLHDLAVPAFSGTKALFLGHMSQSLESFAAYDYIPNHANLVHGDDVLPLEELRVTSGFFHVFQMEPKLGRSFLPAEMAPHAAGAAVISDALWRRQFGADPNIVGKKMILGNRSFTVVGVANPAFRLDAGVDVWTPLPIEERADDQSNMYNFVGRLKPGVTRLQAADDLRRGLAQMKRAYPNLTDQTESIKVEDLHDSLVGQMRPALLVLMGAVGLVLVMVSTNILSLLLTRAVGRRHEMTLRAALGASGWRILRQLLVENALLCLLGGICGVFLATFATPALLHLSPLPVPDFASLHFGPVALFFAAGLVLACALVFSFVPALESRRPQLSESLRTNTAQVAGGRILPQKILVISEVAISLMLLAAAGLLLTSFWKLVHVSPGFDTRNVLTFKTSLSEEQAATSAALGRRIDLLVARLEAQPGVEAVAAANTLPTQLTPTMPFEIHGRPASSPTAGGSEDYMPISEDYFRALGIPVMEGRAFLASDAPGTQPVILINERLAKTYFKGQNPIGQQIRIGAIMGPGFEDSWRTIVGIVGDTKNAGLDAPAPAVLYLPQAQIPDRETQMQAKLLGLSWVVRTKAGIDAGALEAARRIFIEDLHTPLLSVETMPEVIQRSIAQERFAMMLLACFGLIALLMGAAGLYGVMSYSVACRMKEIGVRMAVGAGRGAILGMVLGEAGVLVGVGLAAGIAASIATVQVLRGLLFGIAPRDPLTLAAACGVLLLTGLFAAWLPASRAARTEPMHTLRME